MSLTVDIAVLTSGPLTIDNNIDNSYSQQAHITAYRLRSGSWLGGGERFWAIFERF